MHLSKVLCMRQDRIPQGYSTNDQSDLCIGLGYESGLSMAKAGAHVILGCRNMEKGHECASFQLHSFYLCYMDMLYRHADSAARRESTLCSSLLTIASSGFVMQSMHSASVFTIEVTFKCMWMYGAMCHQAGDSEPAALNCCSQGCSTNARGNHRKQW